MEKSIISQSQFAGLVGVSRQAVGKAIDSHRLSPACVVVSPYGRQLIRELALREWAELHLTHCDKTDDLRANKLAADVAVAEARAAILDLQKREMTGELVRVEAVEREWVDIGTRIRNLLLAMPAVVAAQIDALGARGLKPAQRCQLIEELLDAKIREALAPLDKQTESYTRSTDS